MEPRVHTRKFPGLFIRHVQIDMFLVELFDMGKLSDPNHQVVGYRFWDGDELMFEGKDYGVPRGTKLTDGSVVVTLLGFIGLKPGDTDDEYFENYTPKQLEWADQRAEDVSLYAMELESMWGMIVHADPDKPAFACDLYEDRHHDWVSCGDCWHKYLEVREQ